MKYFIFILLTFVFFSKVSAFAQVGDTVFFDKNWDKTERKHSVYFRLIVDTTGGIYSVRDYYRNTKRLQMQGAFIGAECKRKTNYFAYYNEAGILTHEEHYKYTMKDGVDVDYYQDGRLKAKTNYVLGYLAGKKVTYDSATQKVVTQRSFLSDKLTGEFISYFPGTDLVQRIRHFTNGRQDGLLIAYDSFPHQKTEEGYYFNDFREGVWQYYPSKTHTWGDMEPDMKITMNYKNDELNGAAGYYTTDGKKAAEGYFKDGKKTGLWKYNRYKGSPWRSAGGMYENGKKTGKWVTFNNNSSDTEIIDHFTRGKRNGDHIRYDEYGKLYEGKYRNDTACGKWIYYNAETGTIDHTIDYDESGKSGYEEMFDERSGKRLAYGNIKDGQYDGLWIVFYPGTSDTQMVKHLKNSTQHGYVYYYDKKSKKIILEGAMLNNEKIGPWYSWWPDKSDTVEVRLYTGRDRYIVKTYDSITHDLLWVAGMQNEKTDSTFTTFYRRIHKVKSSASFSNGVKNGRYYEYDSLTGLQSLSGYYLDDNQSGKWIKYFDGSDVIQSIVNYRQGRKDGFCSLNNINGKRSYTGYYKNGDKEGNWCYYDAITGELVEKVRYSEGKKDGKDLFYINGRKQFTTYYNKGERVY